MSSLITINADEYTLSDLPVKTCDHQMNLFALLVWPRLSYVEYIFFFALAERSYFAI